MRFDVWFVAHGTFAKEHCCCVSDSTFDIIVAFDGEAATFTIASVVDCVGGVATIATGREIGRGAGASHSNVVAEFLGREDGVIFN